jgi:hypothetical protein
VLVGCKNINGLEGKIFGFNVSNPSAPVQNFTISRPTSVPNAQSGYKLNVDSSIDGGALLAGNRGALVSPDNGSVFPAECGGVLR